LNLERIWFGFPEDRFNSIGMRSSVPLPKFVIHRGTPSRELRKQTGH